MWQQFLLRFRNNHGEGWKLHGCGGSDKQGGSRTEWRAGRPEQCRLTWAPGAAAQDFHAAFGLGESERRISTIDLDGVALAAIQGLHSLVEEQARVVASQEAIIGEQEARLEALEARITALEGADPATHGTIADGRLPALAALLVAAGASGVAILGGRIRAGTVFRRE